MKSTSSHQKPFCQGFSFVEITVVVCVVVVVASLGALVVGRYKESAEEAKLSNDVVALNKAVQVFTMSGGQLDALTTVDGALSRLKTVASADQKDYIVGHRGSVVDRRILPVMMTAEEQNSSRPRAVWVPAENRFALVTSGPGVKEFVMGTEALVATESVRHATVEYARASDWIWDFTDGAMASRSEYSDGVGTSDESPYLPMDAAGNPLPPSWSSPQQLAPPIISLPTGFYEAASFPLSVTLTNPNPDDSSTIYYAFDSDSWRPYTGGELTVEIKYSTNLRAFAMALDPDYWISSLTSSEVYDTLYISGTVFGEFVEPNGGTTNNNVQELVTTDEYSQFTWGRPQDMSNHTASYLKFAGEEFEYIVPDEYFIMGTLSYYNGGNHGTTGVDELGLALDLQLTVNIPLANDDLTVTFDVVATPDHQWATDAENADYVKLLTPEHEFTTTINDVTYYIVIKFDYVSNDSGFIVDDTFYVHEGATSEVKIVGVLTANPPSEQ